MNTKPDSQAKLFRYRQIHLDSSATSLPMPMPEAGASAQE
jgi:hypothetical protein